jgi:hypothetical protein
MTISPEAPGLHPFSTLTPDMVLDALASVRPSEAAALSN